MRRHKYVDDKIKTHLQVNLIGLEYVWHRTLAWVHRVFNKKNQKQVKMG